jgi:hypothetical protein
VLFGGQKSLSGPALSDTWTWNGKTWTQQHPVTSPSARWEPALAYDAATRTAVLFGGLVSLTVGELGDTWTWR